MFIIAKITKEFPKKYYLKRNKAKNWCVIDNKYFVVWEDKDA